MASKTRPIQFVGLEITGFYEFSILNLVIVVRSVDLILILSDVFSIIGRGKNNRTRMLRNSGTHSGGLQQSEITLLLMTVIFRVTTVFLGSLLSLDTN